jgi:nucleoid-associated protein YgaU
MASPIRVFTITELVRTGAARTVLGTTALVQGGGVQFRWDAASHTAPRGMLEAVLAVKTVRREQPGTSEPVEQVLSSSWQPFELEGEFDDKHAGAGFAMATYRSFAAFMARAPKVRLAFEELALTGLITELKLSYQRKTKVGWSFTFSPHVHETIGDARGAGRIVQPTSKPLREHVDIVRSIATSLSLENDTARTLPVADSTFLDVAASIATAAAEITKIEKAASAGLETEAGQKLLNMAGQFKTIGQAGLAISARVDAARSEASSGFDDPILWLRFDENVHTTRARGLLLTGRALEAEADMRARADAKPRAVHRARAGECLYRISTRYYGTPNEWRRIYDHNRLDSMVLDGTEELVIPERAA